MLESHTSSATLGSVPASVMTTPPVLEMTHHPRWTVEHY
jgi:hypothetical protein